MRYFLDITYLGTAYHGWQRQKNAFTVQQVLEECLSTILRKEIAVVGSGRTDTGVHAAQQVVHFDWDGEDLSPELFPGRCNTLLPKDIAVNSMKVVKAEQHARFDAVSRAYEYYLSDKKLPLHEGKYFRIKGEMPSLEKLNALSDVFLGQQDFQAFSKVKTEVNHFVCTIESSDWVKEPPFLVYKVKADRFLRGMVRALVGTMLYAEQNNYDQDYIKRIIQSKDRREAGAAAPAEGLFLSEVKYK